MATLGLLPPMSPVPINRQRVACDDALAAAAEGDVGRRLPVELAAQCVVAEALGSTRPAVAVAHLLSRGLLSSTLLMSALGPLPEAMVDWPSQTRLAWMSQGIDMTSMVSCVAAVDGAEDALFAALDGTAELPAML
jgi:hypothetical protein